MCPLDLPERVFDMPERVPRAHDAEGSPINLIHGVPGLLQRRRKFAAPLLVNCCAAASKDGQASDDSLQTSSDVGASPSLRLSDRYEVMEILGQGSCGVVRRARSIEHGKVVALKCVHTTDDEFIDITRREYQMLRSVEHPHVIRAIDFFTTIDCAVMVMELFDGAPLDVAVRLSPRKHFEEPLARLFFGQLVQAVAYLHRQGILHRDIKGQNVLVSSNAAQPDLRLVDFNVACRLADGSLTPTGTADYRAPEILAGQSSSQASDVWAAGLCLRLMLSGHLPRRFDTFASKEVFASMIEDCCPHKFSEPCLATLRQCLDAACESRPTAEALLSQAWLSSDDVDVSLRLSNLSAVASSL